MSTPPKKIQKSPPTKKLNAMKKEPFLPNHFYLIKNSSNNFEALFVEERNYSYFLKLCQKHIGKIGSIHSFRLFEDRFELLVHIHDITEIPHKYQQRLHQPFANLFQAYCKGFNKTYDRCGSLFREHFKRTEIDTQHVARLKTTMEQDPITSKNLIL